MKLAADVNHPDYHDIHFFVYVVDQGLYLKACTWVDTETGEYECYETPLGVTYKDEIAKKNTNTQICI